MNKLQGFSNLNKIGIPTVPWQQYSNCTILDEKMLWTIRSAVKFGDDFNLPRKVGVSALEAKEFGNQLLKTLGKEDLVIYYPYFIAEKSGVIEIGNNRTVIEAVKDDLWNLVTENKKDVTIIFEEEDIKIIGDKKFISKEELFQLIDQINVVKKSMNPSIGQSVLLEWSYAYQSHLSKNKVGEKYLIFYELRIV